MLCALCGHRFASEDGRCSPSCPLAGGCTMVCCPNCGYGVPDESRGLLARLLSRFRRWRHGTAEGGMRFEVSSARPSLEPARPGPYATEHQAGAGEVEYSEGGVLITLDRVGAGRTVRVVRIVSENPCRLAQLGDLGIIPGTSLLVVQNRLGSVVRVDETEIALDFGIAREIHVRP